MRSEKEKVIDYIDYMYETIETLDEKKLYKEYFCFNFKYIESLMEKKYFDDEKIMTNLEYIRIKINDSIVDPKALHSMKNELRAKKIKKILE